MTDRPFVPTLCPNGTAVCIGGGPSLRREDVEHCKGKATVVAINDAYKLAPWADVLYACDAQWWKWHGGVPDFHGLKFSLQEDAGRWPGVRVLENTGEHGLETEPTGLRTGRNGGYQAVNLAVHLGATRVLLLGYDMQAFKGRPTHWFGEHPNGGHARYAMFLQHWPAIVKPLQQLGVTVINCSRQTALDLFPRMSITEALA